jgi:hypothetical protein
VPAEPRGNPVAQSRALVPATPETAFEPSPAHRRTYAPFLAHLIATREGFAQTRQKRRAAPERGAAAYRAGLALCRQRADQQADYDA